MLRNEESQPTLKGGELPTGTDLFISIAGTEVNVLKIQKVHDRPRDPFTKSTKNVVLMDGALFDTMTYPPTAFPMCLEGQTVPFCASRRNDNTKSR